LPPSSVFKRERRRKSRFLFPFFLRIRMRPEGRRAVKGGGEKKAPYSHRLQEDRGTLLHLPLVAVDKALGKEGRGEKFILCRKGKRKKCFCVNSGIVKLDP